MRFFATCTAILLAAGFPPAHAQIDPSLTYDVTRSSARALTGRAWKVKVPERRTYGHLYLHIDANSPARLTGIEVITSGIAAYRTPNLSVDDLGVKNTGLASITVRSTGDYELLSVRRDKETKLQAGKLQTSRMNVPAGGSQPLLASDGRRLTDVLRANRSTGCVHLRTEFRVQAEFVDDLGIKRSLAEMDAADSLSKGSCPSWLLPPPPPPPASSAPPTPIAVVKLPLSLTNDAEPTIWRVKFKPITIPRGKVSDLVVQFDNYEEYYAGIFQIRLLTTDGRVFETNPVRLIRHDYRADIVGLKPFSGLDVTIN